MDVVSLLLEHKPNVNALDKDGYTALALACKEGYYEIAVALLAIGAYINIQVICLIGLICFISVGNVSTFRRSATSTTALLFQDRAGDTNLILAVKGGHRNVVEALLKKYADIDTPGKDKKTAIYTSVEKGHGPIVKLLLNANPDLEVTTKVRFSNLCLSLRSAK